MKIDLSGRTAVITGGSRGLGEAMVGINCDTLPESERYANRGW